MTDQAAITAGPLVMALHGSASHPTQWTTLAAMAPDQFHVLAEVMPGYHGRPIANGKGLDRRTMPLITQIEKSGRPVHLVGHSFGGAVALKIVARRPDLVASLTVYEPVLPQILRDDQTPEERVALGELLRVSARLTASVATGHPEDGVAGFIDFWNGPGAWMSQSVSRRCVMADQAVAIMADFQDALGDDLTVEDLGKVEVPVMVLTGTNSPEVSHAVINRLIRSLPNATHAQLNGVGHMAPITHPLEVARVMLDHIIGHIEAAPADVVRAAA